jgi:hypothetical protein
MKNSQIEVLPSQAQSFIVILKSGRFSCPSFPRGPFSSDDPFFIRILHPWGPSHERTLSLPWPFPVTTSLVGTHLQENSFLRWILSPSSMRLFCIRTLPLEGHLLWKWPQEMHENWHLTFGQFLFLRFSRKVTSPQFLAKHALSWCFTSGQEISIWYMPLGIYLFSGRLMD